jgi:RNA methyltransferase, TrmH family
MNESRLSQAALSSVLARVRTLSSRHTRDQQKCFWLEGIRHFIQAFDAKRPLEVVIYSPVLLKSPLAEMLVRQVRASGASVLRVTPEQFRTVSYAERASGIGAIARQHWTALGQAKPDRGLCWLVADQIRSPGNLGTIVRTAEAVGVGGIIFVGPQSDPFDPIVVRSSMGGIHHLSLVRSTLHELASWVKWHRIQLIGLSPEATRPWTEMPSSPPVAIVLGEERGGLHPQLRALCQTTVRLPMTGHADSLNVGVAAGVVLYELVRRAGVLKA